MSSKLYRPKRDDRVSVGQDVLREHAHAIAVGQLVPRIAVQNQIAVETVETPLYFYARIPAGSGRRCSCFDVEVSASKGCRCCYGTGTVGGYDKYGTHLEVIDVTHPSLRTINVIPDCERRSRPRQFVLIDGALRGHVTSRMHIKTNVGIVDHLYNLTDVSGGNNITALIKAPSDQDWQEFSLANIQQRLFNPWLDIRVVLERASLGAPSPRYGMSFLRYKRLEDSVIKANIPRARKAGMLQDIGVADDWQEQHFWTDNTLRSITTDDWVAHINGSTRWKITNVADFAPQGLLTSWDLDTRLVHNYEAMSFFPL